MILQYLLPAMTEWLELYSRDSDAMLLKSSVAHVTGVRTAVDQLWESLSAFLVSYVAYHKSRASESLDDLLVGVVPLLCAALHCPRRTIKDRAITLWNKTFATLKHIKQPSGASELVKLLRVFEFVSEIEVPDWCNSASLAASLPSSAVESGVQTTSKTLRKRPARRTVLGRNVSSKTNDATTGLPDPAVDESSNDDQMMDINEDACMKKFDATATIAGGSGVLCTPRRPRPGTSSVEQHR